MSVRDAFAVALVGCVVALVFVAVTISTVRTTRAIVDRRRDIERKRWLPTILGWTENDAPETDFPTSRGDRRAVVAIATELLPKLRGGDRTALADVLVRHGVLDAALRAARSRRSVVRVRAVVRLDVLARGEEVDMLLELLVDRDPQVRIVAARALGRIGSPAAIPELMHGLRRRTLPTNTVSMAIVRIGPPAVGALLEWLHSNDSLCRSTATEMLGFLGAGEAALDLAGILHDDDRTVAIAAAWSLGRLGLPSTVAALLAALQSAYANSPNTLDWEFCTACLTSLGQIGDRRAVPLLTDSLAMSHRLAAAAAGALDAMDVRPSERPTPPARLKALDLVASS